MAGRPKKPYYARAWAVGTLTLIHEKGGALALDGEMEDGRHVFMTLTAHDMERLRDCLIRETSLPDFADRKAAEFEQVKDRLYRNIESG